MVPISDHICPHTDNDGANGTVEVQFKRFVPKSNDEENCIYCPTKDSKNKPANASSLKYHTGYETPINIIVPTPNSYQELQTILAQRFPTFGGLAMVEKTDGSILSFDAQFNNGDTLIFREVTPHDFSVAKKQCKGLTCTWEKDVYAKALSEK